MGFPMVQRRKLTPGKLRRKWTPERDELLRRMVRSNSPRREIAEVLGGVTRDAVIGRCRRLGLSEPWSTNKLKWTSEENDILRRLTYELRADIEIAEALPGRTAGAVTGQRQSLGLIGFRRQGPSAWQPKDVSVEDLKEKIIRPGIEDRLVPLLHFKGHANLGSMHRLWNLAILMMEAEAEKLGHGVGISLNRDYAHLCGPVKQPNHIGLNSFFSRLILKPDVTNNIPGLLDYSRSVVRTLIHLTPVSEHASDYRCAWWRTYKKAPAKPRIFKPKPELLIYPFLIHEPKRPDEGFDLTKFVSDAVPRGLPPDVRADLCQDMIVAILSGDITRDQVAGSIKEFTRKAFKAGPQKYGHISFDAPLPGMDGRTLSDVLN